MTITLEEVESAITHLRQSGSTREGMLGHDAMNVLVKLYKEKKENGGK